MSCTQIVKGLLVALLKLKALNDNSFGIICYLFLEYRYLPFVRFLRG